MDDLREWVRGLAAAVTAGAPLTASHHRLIQPGDVPFSGSGLVRFQPVGPISRVAQPPEVMSLLGFLTPEAQAERLNALDVATGLAAQLAYLLNRRVELPAEIDLAIADRPGRVTFMPIGGVPDRSLVAPVESGQTTLDELVRRHLGRLLGLPEDDADAVGAAIDLHYAACLLTDRDLASAYTLVVAAIETLSRQFGEPPAEWSDWQDSQHWDRFCEMAKLTSEQRTALQRELMRDRNLRLAETFATYAAGRLPEHFWDGHWRDWIYNIDMATESFSGGAWGDSLAVDVLVPRDRAALKRALKASYQARSGFIHTGGRDVGLQSEMRGMAQPDKLARLGFAGLRLVLRALIDVELSRADDDPGEVPPISFTVEDGPPP